MKKVLIIEDDQIIQNELVQLLNNNGYQALAIQNFKNVVEQVLSILPDLILLDLKLPNQTGFTLCREIKSRLSVKVIIITSQNTSIDELQSFNLGADDFISKPYNISILLARISRLFKDVSQDTLIVSEAVLNLKNATLSYRNQIVELSKNEFKILACLMSNQGKVVTVGELTDYLWNTKIYIDENTLKVSIARLRKKLDTIDLKDFIKTRRSIGYQV